jgi:hypothetical protein
MRSVALSPRAVAGVLVSVTVALLLVVLAAPAHAHGRGSDATNYHSSITAAPELPGITWEIYGGDELLGVTNDSDVELVVYGYEVAGELEEYARVGPEGVFVNTNARATYENTDRYAQVTIPTAAQIGGEPDWEQVSSGTSFAWHDHRMHWMARNPPRALTDPSVATVVFPEWEIPFRYDGADRALTGQLVWVPGPSPWPYLAVGLLLVLPALAGLGTRPVDGRWPGLVRPAAVVLALVVAVNLTHLVDDLFYAPFDVATRAVAAVQTVLFLGIGAFGAVRAWQARDGAFTALGVGAGAVLVGQGLLYISVLGASQNASLLPELVSRTVVAVSLAQALPLAVVAVLGTRALLPPPDEPAPSETTDAHA